MKDFQAEFEKEQGITENYDPDHDRETGYYSMAYWTRYANWLETELTRRADFGDRVAELLKEIHKVCKQGLPPNCEVVCSFCDLRWHIR